MSEQTQNELGQFLKENSKYVSWEDDNGKEWLFVDAKQVLSSFGGQTIEYTLKGTGGYEKKFTSSSLKLAREMLKLIGKKVLLTKSGEGPKTSYSAVEVK